MSEENKDKKENAVIVLGGESLPDVKRLTPKHFDFLEKVLDELHFYQYRHIQYVSWKRVLSWVLGVIGLVFYRLVYIHNSSFGDLTVGMLVHLLVVLLIIGALSIFSRCFTRLYHFKFTVLRVCQFDVGLLLFDFLFPYLLVMENWIGGFESVLEWSRFPMIIVLCWLVITAYVPSRWLRVSRIGYFLIVSFVFGMLHFHPGVRHFIFKNNELTIHSDYGTGKAVSVDTVDSIVDELTGRFK